MNYNVPAFQPGGDGYGQPEQSGYSYHPGMPGPNGMNNMPGGPAHPEGLFKFVHRDYTYEHSLVSSVKFDSEEEIVWVGSESGYVSSYHGHSLQRYTAFRVNTSFPVKNLVTLPQNIMVLTAGNLRSYSRFGICQREFTAPPELGGFECMSHTSGNTLLVGGQHDFVYEMDLSTLRPIYKHKVETDHIVIIKETPRNILLADAHGSIYVRDNRSMKFVTHFKAHDSMSDFDVHENQIVTCGYANVRGTSQPDRMLKVYDLRAMRGCIPIHAHIEPYLLKYIPTYASQLLVMSALGKYQIIDMTGGAALNYEVQHLSHLDTNGHIFSLDVSSSMKELIVGDTAGGFGLYSSEITAAPFNPYSRETQFAQVEERLPHMDINNETAVYSSLPMFYPPNGERLLSDWPQGHMTDRMYNKPVPIDPRILNNMKMQGQIGYAKLPEGMNQWMPYNTSAGASSHRGGHHNPGTHHVNINKPNKSQNRGGQGRVPPSPIGRKDDPMNVVPKQYQRVEIKYSKLGVTDFDFRHYNKTHFAGLEPHIPNAYCNAMLQVLYFLAPLRAALLNHLCGEEFCLACELGMLFHMLDESKGMTCQASNFLRAFRTIPEASSLNLIFNDSDETQLKTNQMARIIQSWSRFVLQQIHSELSRPLSDPTAIAITERGFRKEKKGSKGDKSNKNKGTATSEPDTTKAAEATIIQQLFGSKCSTTLMCKCGENNTRDTESFLYNLVYPEAPVDVPSFEFTRMSFSQIVADSMNASQSIQSWCNKCKKYQQHKQRRVLSHIPDVIGLNCQVDNDTTLDFWKRQLDLLCLEGDNSAKSTPQPSVQGNKKPCRYGMSCTRADCYFYHEGRDVPTASSELDTVTPCWVPLDIQVVLDTNGHVTVSDLDETSKISENGVAYELLASIAHIRDLKSGGNLVSHIYVNEEYHQRKEGITTTQHYLFNDFSISDITKEEAVQFNMDWKWPCALFFVKKKLKYDIEVRKPLEIYDTQRLFTDAALKSGRVPSTMLPLDENEILSNTAVIGIDAEFVSLNQEEAELRSDGTKSTLKPTQLSLARVTCIRGKCENFSSDLHLMAFMDDYISTQEEVVDYLTQFSGIKPGDLDKSLSSKHLTTLKSMYMRLRYMVDKGVIFVGHGLKSDFRVINIVIPTKQVMDTVDLFHLPRQRLLSLKFLAWYFLGILIQGKTHDSTEDAQTAMKLYEKYVSMKNEIGINGIKKLMLDVYDHGRHVHFKVPACAPNNKPAVDMTVDQLKELQAKADKMKQVDEDSE